MIRPLPDGRLGRSFGRGGGVLIGNGTFTAIGGLALRGDRILAAATFTRFAGLADVADGDRLFGGEETVSVFSTPGRILMLRSGFYAPLLSFTPRGRLERDFPRRVKGLVPRRQKEDVPVGPAATLDGGALLLAWAGAATAHEGHGGRDEVNLQRLLLR